jgi:hypothetical protein
MKLLHVHVTKLLAKKFLTLETYQDSGMPDGIFYGHLVLFVAIWYIVPRFGVLYEEKYVNPVLIACNVI